VTQDATLVALAAFPAALQAHFSLFREADRGWAPASWDGIPSEALTAIEQVCHVLDIEVEGYQRRIARTLAEDRPVLPSIDTDRLARERDYAGADAVQVLAQFHAARAATLRTLATLTPAQYQRRALFEGYGEVTVRGLVHYLCSHDQQHLAGLQWLLGKLQARDDVA
jgi:hypothetical protein